MEALPYLLKVNICWAIFYGCYWLLFRKHTFFHLNRFYLLFSLLISFVIPAVEVRETVTAPTTATAFQSNAMLGASPLAAANPLEYGLLLAYAAGAIAMLFAFVKALFHIRKIIQNGMSVPMQGYRLVISPRMQKPGGSFSFLKWMVISNDDYERNFEPIFMHEMVHIRQWHSLDILLIEVLMIAFWFNPFLWLYKSALQDTHEYLADEQAPNRDQYATFLLAYCKNALVTSVTHQFFNSSLIRKRIRMIYRDRTAKWLKSKYLLLCPVLALSISLLAARTYVPSHPKQAKIKPKMDSTIELNPIQKLPERKKKKVPVTPTRFAADTLPTTRKEKALNFWGNRSMYSPAPTAPFGKKHLEEFYEGKSIDLRDSIPPATNLHRYGVSFTYQLPIHFVDLKIKYKKE